MFFLEVVAIAPNAPLQLHHDLHFFVYKNDIPQALSNDHMYLHADDTSIIYQHNEVAESKMFSTKNLQMCENGLLIRRCEFILVK